MMSIPNSAPSTPSNVAPEPAGSVAAGSAAAPASPEGAAGFMALIGSLLQGAAPPAGVPSLTSDAVPADAPVPAEGAMTPTADAAEPAQDLLASLGLASTTSASTATPQPVPPAVLPAATDAPARRSPRSSSEVAADASERAARDAALGTAAAALLAAATAAPPAAVEAPPAFAPQGGAARADVVAPAPADPRTVAPAGGDATAAAARPAAPATTAFLALIDGASPTGDETDPLVDDSLVPSTGGTSTQAGQAANGTPSLEAWAATAHRLAGAQDAAPRAAGVNAEAQLRESVGTPRWKDELGARITLMAVQGQQSGSLRLSPEHLGPLEIQINVADDKTTSVQFGAQHAETRTALQDALPRLREMFAAAGLQLGDAGVSGQAPRERPSGEAVARASGYEARSDGEPTPVRQPVRSVTHSGLLDTYA